jgi:hypothetical protein
MFYNHASFDPPIGRWERVRVVGKRLVGRPVFASEEDPARAGMIERLWDGGFLDDVSVSYRVDSSALGERRKVAGVEYRESWSHELIECSIVCIGADPKAGKGRLAEAVSRGIITDAEARSLVPVDKPSPSSEIPNHVIEDLHSMRSEQNKGMTELRAELDRLRSEVARLDAELANVLAAAPEIRGDNLSLDAETIRREIRRALPQPVDLRAMVRDELDYWRGKRRKER